MDTFSLLIAAFIHVTWSAAAAGINPDLRRLGILELLIVVTGTAVSAVAVLALCFQFEIGSTTAWATSIVAALLANEFLLVWRSPRHLVLWRLALNNLRRRKRNSALMAVGLIVGAAVVSSSLVVGDSLDATIEEAVLISADKTDISISGLDVTTGRSVFLNESHMREFGEALNSDPLSSPHIDGFNIGITTSVSILNEASSLGEPRVEWYAFDPGLDAAGSWSALGGASGLTYSDIAAKENETGEAVIVINRALADSLKVEQDEQLRIAWTVNNADGTSVQRTERLDVWRVVEMKGAASPLGRSGEVIFTTLQRSQEWLEIDGGINQIHISAKGGAADSLAAEKKLFPHVERLLDDTLSAADAGYLIENDEDSSSLMVARASGTARLSTDEVEYLRNVTEGVENASRIEMVQAPLLLIKQGPKNLSGLQSNAVQQIDFDEAGTWYLTSTGVTFESGSHGSMSSWTVPNQGLAHSMTDTKDGGVLVAYDRGVYRAHPARNITSFEHDIGLGLDSSITSATVRLDDSPMAWAIERNGTESWQIWAGHPTDESVWQVSNLSLPGAPSTILDGTILHDGQALIIELEGLLSHKTWRVPDDGSAIEEFDSINREPTIFNDAAWLLSSDDMVRLSDNVSVHELGLPEGEISAVGGAGVLISSTSAGGELQAWEWNDSAFQISEIEPPEGCDGTAVFVMGDTFACSCETGVLLDIGGLKTGRLPLLMEVEGASALPLLLLGIVAPDLTFLPDIPAGEVLLSEWAVEGLQLEGETNLSFVGLLAAANGDFLGHNLHHNGSSTSLPDVAGLEVIQSVAIGMVNITDAATMSVMESEERSLFLLTGGNLTNSTTRAEVEDTITEWLDERTNASVVGVFVNRIKHDGLETADEASGGIAGTFIVFGSFTIIAGLLLVVNIFVMLAEERKPEMGMARALGLQRPDLRSLFVLEGSVVAVFSSAAGAILGLGIAWFVAQAFSFVFSSRGGSFVYSWSYESVAAGFAFGFLVTWVTLWATALRNSRMNVVAAMRDLPRNAQVGPAWWVLLAIFGMLGLAGLTFLSFLALSKGSEWRHVVWTLTGYLAVLGLAPLVAYVIPHLLHKKPGMEKWRRNASRNGLGLTGLGLLLWTVMPDWLDPVRAGLDPSEYSFIASGVFGVAAGVMLLTSVAPMLARVIGRLATVTKRIGPVVPTALAYPLATPFRTALTLGMFSLTVFSVVVLAGYSAQFGTYSSGFVDEAQGEFEIIGSGSLDRPLDLSENSSEWTWGDADPENFDAIGRLSLGIIKMEQADSTDDNQSLIYYLRGVDKGFTEHGGLPLHIWDERVGSSSEEIWKAVEENPSLALVDASFGLEMVRGDGERFNPLVISIGDSISLIDPSNPSNTRDVTIVGFLEQGSMWSTPGVFVSEEVAHGQFHSTPTRIYLSVESGMSLEEKMAIAEDLEVAFLDQGMQVSVIEYEVREFQSIVFSIFDIFQAYLGLGLAVGIAGLGVVTIRAVSERSHQTGILRAIGFQRRMVVGGYLLELTWISLLGVLNGVVVGVGFHWYLYTKFWQERGEEFAMPWQTISLVVLASYVLVILATALPVRRAAGIHPAEALRELS